MTLDQATIDYLKAELAKIGDRFEMQHIDAVVAAADAPHETTAEDDAGAGDAAGDAADPGDEDDASSHHTAAAE